MQGNIGPGDDFQRTYGERLAHNKGGRSSALSLWRPPKLTGTPGAESALWGLRLRDQRRGMLRRGRRKWKETRLVCHCWARHQREQAGPVSSLCQQRQFVEHLAKGSSKTPPARFFTKSFLPMARSVFCAKQPCHREGKSIATQRRHRWLGGARPYWVADRLVGSR